MKKPETKFKDKTAPLLRSLPNSWWVKTAMVSVRGIPDWLGCVNGRFVALELKKDLKAPIAPLQELVLQHIRKAGGYAEVVAPENWEDVYKDLKRINQGYF